MSDIYKRFVNGVEVFCDNEGKRLECGNLSPCHYCPAYFWQSIDWELIRKKWWLKNNDSCTIEEYFATVLAFLTKTEAIDVLKCSDQELTAFFQEFLDNYKMFERAKFDDPRFWEHLGEVATRIFPKETRLTQADYNMNGWVRTCEQAKKK